MIKSDKFIRDEKNPGAVLNTDNNALQMYKLKKAKSKEIELLKQEIYDIKNMLQILINKK